MSGKKPSPDKAKSAADISRAIMGLENKPTLALKELLQLLKECWLIVESRKPTSLGIVRKAIARVDELYFAEAGPKVSETARPYAARLDGWA
jgi:hypothetical protein